MIQHYLTVALRNMRRFKLQTIVCITGLAVGMTCFALGTLWLRYIESFEDFVPEAEDICFVSTGTDKFRGGYSYASYYDDGRNIMENRAEVKDYCTIMRNSSGAGHSITLPDSRDDLLHTVEADTTFIRWFGIKAVEGSVERMDREDMFLTLSAARRLFGSAREAMGKRVKMNAYNDDPRQFTVVAVLADCPHNTQFDYEAIIPWNEDGRYREEGYSFFQTFVRLHKKAPRDSIVGRNIHIVTKRKNTYGGLFDEKMEQDFILVPILDLRADYPCNDVLISTSYVRWFTTLGLLVIVCSLFNYVITMVSHLRRRGWEMSLRRVLGASIRSILFMVGIETLILLFLATLLGFALTQIVMPQFCEYSGIGLSMADIALRLAGYLAAVVVFSLACSSLTAWIVMRRTQRGILSSRQLSHSSTPLDRMGVTLQMALSMAIIFAVSTMLRQVRYMMYSDEMGFTHNDIGIVYAPSEEMRQRIMTSPLVEETLSDVVPIFPLTMRSGMTLSSDSTKRGNDISVDCRNIDSLTYTFFHMTLVAGRLPRPSDNTGSTIEACVNESFCQAYGYTPQTVIGKAFASTAWQYLVTGVLRNTYTLGPTVQSDPQLCFHPVTAENNHATMHTSNITFRTRPGRLKECCDSLTSYAFESGNEGMAPVNIEEQYNKFVQSELMLIKILMAVGGASLFVCVIGTFSLVSLSLQQRRKEIAIRKVHGAKMRDILRLFLRGQVTALIIAALAAYPVAYILMRHWLEGYQKQVAISWWLIPTTFAAIAAVVLGTITLKIWHAARESTVSALNA